jgi:phosphosulfolactate phosphohydrolase-like enzyme
MQGRTRREVLVDALTEGVHRHRSRALVVVDVLLSSTTLVTAAAQGRQTLITRSVEEGRRRARGLSNPLLASEPCPSGTGEFDPRTGPRRLDAVSDPDRPFLLLTPAADVLASTLGAPAVYLACLRNISATVEAVAEEHEQVAVIAAGHAGQPRSEDQMVAAWIAGRLVEVGYAPGNLSTAREVERWAKADLSMLALGRGADQLRRLGRDSEIDFVLRRVDDLELTCRYEAGEVSASWPAPARIAASAH